MFCATVKIAYGYYTTSKNLARNLTKNEVIHELQTLVKNNFNVEDDAVIQIVKSDDMPYAELNPELSENDVLRRENEMFFYARIIRRFNNIEYMKTDMDRNGTHRICYLKKEDLDLRRYARFYTEADILSGAQVQPEESVQESAENVPDTVCVICSENEVYRERRFECEHLFCSNCHSQWLISSSHYNCPLCRS